jgi:hypothetical protein
MAGRKRAAYFTPSIGRTIERVAIAALAALATRGEGGNVALAAITIFVIVAIGEEIGRGFVLRGRRVTLRDLAYSAYFERRLPGREPRRRHRSRSKRAGAEPGGSATAPGAVDDFQV